MQPNDFEDTSPEFLARMWLAARQDSADGKLLVWDGEQEWLAFVPAGPFEAVAPAESETLKEALSHARRTSTK